MIYNDNALSLPRIMPIHIKYLTYIFGCVVGSILLVGYSFIVCNLDNLLLANINNILRIICTIFYLVICILAVIMKEILKWEFGKSRVREFNKFVVIGGVLLVMYYTEKFI